MKRFIHIHIICLFIVSSGYGQEYPMFGQFFTNPYIINPAYVGIEGRTAMYLTHRQQWMGVEGAPVSSNFNIHSPLVAGLSGGLNFYNDSRGLRSTNVASLTAGYTLSITEKEHIRFGLSAGAGFYNFDRLSAYNPDDPAIIDIAEKNTFLTGNFGVTLHSGYFTLGIALPSIFGSDLSNTDSFSGAGEGLSVLDQFTVNTSYRFYFGLDEMAFEPHLVFYKYKGLPSQLEAAGIFHIKYNLWAGASYRMDFNNKNIIEYKSGFGFSGLVGIKIKENLSIGYSYTLPLESNSIGIPTHEFQLGLLLKKKKKKNLHVVSFINSERTYWGVDAEDANAFFAEDSENSVPPVEAYFDFERSNSEINTIGILSAELDLSDQNQSEYQLRVPRLDMETITVLADHEYSDVDENHFINSGDRYEVISHGGHALEIDRGYYIVAETFEDFEDVKTYRDDIRSSGSSVQYGFGSQTNLWYVSIFKNESPVGVVDKLNVVRQEPRFADAWILIVE